jgi:uncharacterized protein YajQ (UPF0234 family)
MASFDVVSQTDTQEVRNAVDQAAREIGTRFDFKDTDSTIALEGDKVEMASNTDDKLRQVIDVFESKLIKRKVSLKSFDRGEIREASGGSAKTSWTIVNGIPTDTAKRISKFVRDPETQGHPSSDPGGPTPRHRQKDRRSAGRHRRVERARFRLLASVHQLPFVARTKPRKPGHMQEQPPSDKSGFIAGLLGALIGFAIGLGFAVLVTSAPLAALVGFTIGIIGGVLLAS